MLPKIKTILYATSMCAGAPHVFRYALALAGKYDAQIVAVSALEPLSGFAQNLVELHLSEERSEEIHTRARDYAMQRLRERIEKLCDIERQNDPEGINRVSEIRIKEGQAAHVVLEAARECNADVIVMGSHRHTVIGDALLGTTTHKVLHSADQPVLVVRIPEGFHEEGF